MAKKIDPTARAYQRQLLFFRSFPRTAGWVPIDASPSIELLDTLDHLQGRQHKELQEKLTKIGVTLDEVAAVIWKHLKVEDSDAIGAPDHAVKTREGLEWYAKPGNRKALRKFLRNVLPMLQKAQLATLYDGREKPPLRLEGKQWVQISDRFRRLVKEIPFLADYLRHEPKFILKRTAGGRKPDSKENRVIQELGGIFSRKGKIKVGTAANVISRLLSVFGVEKDIPNIVRILKRPNRTSFVKNPRSLS